MLECWECMEIIQPTCKTNECDLLIGIGMRFETGLPVMLKQYAKQAKIIHLEIDKAEINKVIHVDVAIHGDVKDTLPLLTKLIEKRIARCMAQ